MTDKNEIKREEKKPKLKWRKDQCYEDEWELE